MLQTAVTHPERLEFFHHYLDTGDYNYYVYLYFLEVNDTVHQTGQRVFDIYINDVKQRENFDVLANGSNYKEVFLKVTANGFLNLTFVKVFNGSVLGPICNAYEIFQVHPWVQESNQKDGQSSALAFFPKSNLSRRSLIQWSRMINIRSLHLICFLSFFQFVLVLQGSMEELYINSFSSPFPSTVDVIVKVRDELLDAYQNNEVLETWTGDPCLPVPWKGLQCEPINGSYVITKL